MLSREIRELEYVPRWGIIRVIKRQSVAEHSYFTAMYANSLALFIGWSCKNEDYMWAMLTYALWHDAEECFMSDIPGPIKRGLVRTERYNEFAKQQSEKNWGIGKHTFLEHLPIKIVDEIKLIVKCASTMDELFYLMGEEQMGNKTITRVMQCSFNTMNSQFDELPFTDEESRDIAETHLEKIIRNHKHEYSALIDHVELEG